MLFHLCALFYGDFPDLARRLLESLCTKYRPYWPDIADIRIGLNNVSTESRQVIMTCLRQAGAPAVIYEAENGANVYKYPLMRRMLYDGPPLRAPFVQWFDDDSYLTNLSFWPSLITQCSRLPTGPDDAWILGSVYRAGYHYAEEEAVQLRQQPWFSRKPIVDKPTFCTGGWWTAPVAFLKRWGYPWPCLQHNGGDVLLGELIRQRSGHLVNFRHGVAVNADSDGKESAAKRRGVTTLRPWQAGEREPFDPAFACRITELAAGEPRGN